MAKKNAEFCKSVKDKIEGFRQEFKDNIDNYHVWFNFVMGNQWEDEEEDNLIGYGKMPLVINKLSPLAKHILGEQRQNTPNLQAIPNEDADVETSQVRDALIKHIMFSSDAKTVYQTSFQQAVIGGYGAYYIDTDYENNYSFSQEPRPTMLRDATKAYWDLSSATVSKTDGMFSGFITRMSREAFRQKYGKKLEASIGENYGQLDTKFVWSNNDEVTVIRHYERKIIKDTLYQLSNGERILQEELDKSIDTFKPEGYEEAEDGIESIVRNGEVVFIEKKRVVYRDEVTVYKLAGDYILEESEYPCDELGVIFVDQNSWWDKKNKQICVPYFKDARDAQKYLNYLATQSAYIWKVARYDQFMASKANVKSPQTQAIWTSPATYQGALIYDVDLEGGTKPERLTPPELPQSFITQYQRALDDIHSSTGIYGTQVGQQGAELSGAAVDARTRQGSYVSYVVYDSLNRSLATTGRMINQMITRLYDEANRVVTMEMPDKGLQRITLNKQDEYGNALGNSMTEGEYKVRLMPGPSYEGQQAQSIESFNVVLQADKSGQVFPLIADLYVDNLTMNNKVEVKNRIRTIVPQEIVQAGKTGQPLPPKPPQPDPNMIMAMAKMKEADAKAAKLQQEAEHFAQDYQAKMAALEVERVEAAAGLQEQELRYMAEMGKTKSDQQIAHANNIVKILTHLKEPQPTQTK